MLLQEIWMELLGKECLAYSVGFLSAGGDEIMAARLVEAIRQSTGVHIPLNRDLKNISLRDLWPFVNDALTVEPPASQPLPDSGGDPRSGEHYPVPPRIRTLLDRYMRFAGRAQRPLPTTGFISRGEGSVDIDRLHAAFRRLVEQHDVLRIVFRDSSGGFIASVSLAAEAHVRILDRFNDRGGVAGTPISMVGEKFLPEESLKARLILAVVDDDEYLLGFGANRLVCDGETLKIIERDPLSFYSSPSYRSSSGSYMQNARWYLKWPDSDRARDDFSYWSSKIEDRSVFPRFEIPGAALPGTRRDVDCQFFERRLPTDAKPMLVSAASTLGATPFTVFAAVISAAGLQYGCTDIAFVAYGSGHVADEVRDVVCGQNNTMLLWPQLSAPMRFGSLTAALRDEVAAAMSHTLFTIQQLEYSFAQEQNHHSRSHVSLLIGCDIVTASPSVERDTALELEHIKVTDRRCTMGCDVRLREEDGRLFVSVANPQGWIMDGFAQITSEDLAAGMQNFCWDTDTELARAARWCRWPAVSVPRLRS
ncbi:condensation domain-containing protein [Nocardia beijingensis]|uniref:condensation domain-containing protein n=1 Tax=Nocardia beijingensis TaxID=95162 RepID=UPI00344E4717